ncbi:MAG: DUF4837 family protein [Candidatus Marinimicrobia bacterium]|nr:DUF4837 family protein [Candidatus Neomarinimicrobiota bacterium]MBT3618557.1 DUF4837 family protein [Candidatus Neomarinimicrobiota bacterium]MBT3828784.1 DUF4837 family protein [Candidatus Neomarinimicrobiota bacterium]MBT3996854.1 DUF4837 family protein [Candidatus Neomarinimicrobiota bacterium]MBT4280995.1 DUF4837 family protein [Candidatus Neomarinimicrobiota bacterium]
MNKLTSLCLILLFFNCDLPKRNALGADNELLVVCSKDLQNEMRSVLSIIFSDTLFTPQPEPLYRLVFVEPNQYSKIKQNVNIVFGSIGTDLSDPGTKLVKSLLSKSQYEDSMHGANQLILSKNVFAQDQLVLFINGTTYSQIKNRAHEQASKILSYYETLYEKRQKKHLFENARQEDLEKRILQAYGWSMKIPWGYTILQEDQDRGIFWIGRDIPYRWFAIHWEDGLVVSDSASADQYFRNFTEEMLGSIQLNAYKFSSELEPFNDWTTWTYGGIWEHQEEAQGGPFKGYLFYDGISNKTYAIFLLVFHPGNDKSLLLKQLDFMAHSFFVDENGYY